MTTEFLDHLAGTTPVEQGRGVPESHWQSEEAVYASKPEAERSFRALVEEEPACRESNPEMKRVDSRGVAGYERADNCGSGYAA
jgi:hypothetical protein